MLNRLKIWASIATLFTGALLAGGCGWLTNWGDGGTWWWIRAILQEDLFS